jgi:thymidylate synthase ThyX
MKHSKSEIRELLVKLVKEIDYDIYKNLLVKDCQEEPEQAEKTVKRLIEIVEDWEAK